MVFKTNQRGMFVVLLLRLLTFLIVFIFSSNFPHIKRKLLLAVVFILSSRWHQNVFQSKLIIVGVVKLILNHCRSCRHWLNFKWNNIIRYHTQVISINLDVWTSLAIRTRDVSSLLSLVFATIITTRATN